MALISQRSIDEVKEATVLSEIIAESVSLERRGRTVKACCPFHAEKTPSFHIHDEEGYYYCFGCGETGNVFSFLMKTQGMSFPEVVEYLAEKYGITLEKSEKATTTQGNTELRRRILRMNIVALEFFRHSLDKSAPGYVQEYVLSRGLNDAVIKRFAIGYAPEDWRALTTHFLKLGANENELVQSGLARRGKNGELYDLFRGRLIFPILGENKRVLAFGGRLVPSPHGTDNVDAPKYVNSPETEVYHKSATLYGLPYAIKDIRAQKRVMLVEGYMDVIALHGSGIRNVVATCGTSLTEQHLEKLSRVSSRIELLFDGDDAGVKAAARIFPLSLNISADITVCRLPKKHDPDTFMREHAESAQQAIDSLPRESLATLFIEQERKELELDESATLSPAQKGLLARAVCAHLMKVQSIVVREQLLSEAARLLQVTSSVLSEELKTLEQQGSPKSFEKRQSIKAGNDVSLNEVSSMVNQEQQPESVRMVRFDELSKAEQVIIRAAMVKKETLPGEILRDPAVCPLLSQGARHFFESLDLIMNSNDDGLSSTDRKDAVKILLEGLGKGWTSAWADAYRNVKDSDYSLEDEYKDALFSLAQLHLRQTLRDLDEKVRFCANEEEKAKLLQQKLQFEQEVRRRQSR